MRLAVMGSFASIYMPAFYPFLSFCSTSWGVFFVYIYISFIFYLSEELFISTIKFFFLNHLSVPLKNHPTLVLLIFLKDLMSEKIVVS